jgi:hypothetical protein
MIRNLKVLLAAALALAAFGAITASAHAADEFRCTVAPCRGKLSTDGTLKTAHHVFIVENGTGGSVSFTCESLRGTAEFVSGTDVSLSWSRVANGDREAYDNCEVSGSPGVIVHMNDCKYTFTRGSTTDAAAGTKDEAEVHVECPVGETIEITMPPPSTCVFRIGAQTLGGSNTKGGIGYHTEGTEVTVTANVKGIQVTTNGNCSAFITGTLEGTYTTGNTLVTGEKEDGTMATASFG